MARFTNLDPATVHDDKEYVNAIMSKVIEANITRPTEKYATFNEPPQGYDIENFFDDLTDFLKSYQENTGEFKNFSFGHSDIYNIGDNTEENAIRYKILRTTHGSVTQSSKLHDGVTNHRWVPIGELDDVENPGYKVIVLSKNYDHTIQITSWSKNYRDANLGANAVQDLIDAYSGIFRLKGLRRIEFEERLRPEKTESGGITYHGIPLNFSIQACKIKLIYQKVLESIVIDLFIK